MWWMHPQLYECTSFFPRMVIFVHYPSVCSSQVSMMAAFFSFTNNFLFVMVLFLLPGLDLGVQSNLDYPNLDYPNSRLSELEMQRKFRVKVHIVTTWLDCACAVNLRRVIATREPAAALLSNLVLTLKEVKEMHGKRSINRGWVQNRQKDR